MAVQARDYIPVTKAFKDVGPQLWTCSRCGGRGTYANPLDVELPPDPDGPYSQLFVHRKACPS
jgi:hypothetical protein